MFVVPIACAGSESVKSSKPLCMTGLNNKESTRGKHLWSLTFDIALELLWMEHFDLKGLHQLYTPQTVQKSTM